MLVNLLRGGTDEIGKGVKGRLLNQKRKEERRFMYIYNTRREKDYYFRLHSSYLKL